MQTSFDTMYKSIREADTGKALREANAAFLVRAVKAIDVPTGWHTGIADRSVYVANPSRTKTVKVDESGTMTIDIVTKGNVKSSKFSWGSVEKAWPAAAQAIKSYIKMEQTQNEAPTLFL